MLGVHTVACERGARRLFAGLSLALEAGGLVRVRGPNGSGKTSLLRILAGLTRPAEGAVRWRGSLIGELAEEYGSEMLYLGHAPAVKDDLSVEENLAFAARLSGIAADAGAIRAALERLGIGEQAQLPVRVLSQGQKRRAALARLALAATRPLWLLDEPFAALDEDAIGRVRALVTAHLSAGGMVVLTSHQEFALQARAEHSIVLGS